MVVGRNRGSLLHWEYLGTAACVAYQYEYNDYLGPSPIVAVNLRVTDSAAAGTGLDVAAYRADWWQAMAREAGHALPDPLDATTEEALSKRVFLGRVKAQPLAFVTYMTKTVVMYAFAPLEVVPALVLRVATSREALGPAGRLALAGLLAPFWLLALVPGPWMDARMRRITWAGMAWLAVWLGLSALAPGQGEQMRLPVVPLLLPAIAWNMAALARVAARFRQR